MARSEVVCKESGPPTSGEGGRHGFDKFRVHGVIAVAYFKNRFGTISNWTSLPPHHSCSRT